MHSGTRLLGRAAFKESYRTKWAVKLEWYRQNGIEVGGGPNGTLVISEDGANGSFSSTDIQLKLEERFG